MSAFAKDPWGKHPLNGRPSDQSRPVRRVGPCAAGVTAPGEACHAALSSGAGFAVLTVAVPDSVAMLLRLIGAHDGVDDEGEVISRLVVARAEAIGIARLADFQQGREAESRVAHNHEVAGSSPAPATSFQDLAAEGLRSGRDTGRDAWPGLRFAADIPPESADRGGGGNPAVPASAAGPP